MIIYIKNNKGFTLIELLVVVAVISLLSSIVFASLSSARSKSKDSFIKEEVSQLTNLMALNYSDYGSFCQLQYGWTNTNSGACDTIFSGTYTNQARQICSNIFNNASYTSINVIYSNTTTGCATTYSFMVHLNNGKWFCSGSSGMRGEYSAYNAQPGCYNNP